MSSNPSYQAEALSVVTYLQMNLLECIGLEGFLKESAARERRRRRAESLAAAALLLLLQPSLQRQHSDPFPIPESPGRRVKTTGGRIPKKTLRKQKATRRSRNTLRGKRTVKR